MREKTNSTLHRCKRPSAPSPCPILNPEARQQFGKFVQNLRKKSKWMTLDESQHRARKKLKKCFTVMQKQQGYDL
jgi:hypothetical protein